MLYLVALVLPPLAILLCRKWAQVILSLVLTGALWLMVGASSQVLDRLLTAINRDNNLPGGLGGIYVQVWMENSLAYILMFVVTLALLVLAIGHAIFVVHNRYADQRNDSLVQALNSPTSTVGVE